MDNSIEARDYARKMIKEHEGYSQFPKPDAKGTVQIGYGTNLTLRGLEPGEADWLVIQDVNRLHHFLTSFPWYSALSINRKAVLIDMAYNLGRDGLQGFGKMLAAIEAGDFKRAALEIYESKWAAQVGSRAVVDAELMRNG